MSGQTYATAIRIPTPQERAERAALDAKNQSISQASGVVGLDALMVVLDATSMVTVRQRGTVRPIGAHSASAEVMVHGAPAAVRVDVDDAKPDQATVRIDFARSQGLSCADEAKVAGEIAAAMARAGLRPDTPTSGAAVTAPGKTQAERSAG
jgi:hypothetical protein